METVVTVLMTLIALSFILKQSFGKPWTIVLMAFAAALFTGLMWPFAIEQSKSQINLWLADPSLMLDVAVVLSIEVILQITFCTVSVTIATEGFLPKWKIFVYKILRWFPGVLIFPVLFSALVYVIFAFPGTNFKTTAWTLAWIIFALIIIVAWGLRKIIPEKELRLELLFILNALIALFGVIATVNGQVTVDGFSEVDWNSLFGFIIITIAGTILGCGYYLFKIRYKKIK